MIVFFTSPLVSSFLTSCLLFLICLIAHVPITRLKGNSRFVSRSLVLGVGLGILYFFAKGFLSQAWIATLVETFFFLALWNMFLIFMINLLNSFSLRMVGEIYLSRNQKLNKIELDAIFSDAESFNARLKAMEQNGFIHWNKKSGSIELIPKGLAYGNFFSTLRRLLGIKVYG